MIDEKTTLSVVASSLQRAMLSIGLDADRLFKHVGIDLSKTPYSCQEVTQQSLARLVKICARISCDPAFGLRMATSSHTLRFGLLSSALHASESLRDYFKLHEKYAPLLSTYWTYKLVQDKTQAKIAMLIPPHLKHPIQSDWSAAALLAGIRQVYRDDFFPNAVDLSRPTPKKDLEKYKETFGVTPCFDAIDSALYMDSKILDTPLRGHNPDILEQLIPILDGLVAKTLKDDIVSTVKTEIIRSLPKSGANMEAVADKLNMCTRTLHNKLRSNGTTFQKILDETRTNLSKHYIQQGLLPFKHIAYILGYHDYSNFSRSFKRKTGLSPNEYRDRGS